MWDTGQDGTLEKELSGTGRDFRKRIKQDRTGREKKVRDTKQDGMIFWLSPGALMPTSIEYGRIEVLLLNSIFSCWSRL